MATPRVLVLRAPGANCDLETQFAFERAGARAERVHVNALRQDPSLIHRHQILALPGGFSYGDDIAAGRILASELKHFLGEALRRFRDAEKLILGVCNGFQALLSAGLLLAPDDEGPLATLACNESSRFEDRWIELQARPGKCPFLRGYERLYLPVAHAEGRLRFRRPWIRDGLDQAGQIVLRYVAAHGNGDGYPANPNGSEAAAAGLCDATGRVLGLMPHPERHVLPTQHPRWTRTAPDGEGDGLRLFRNAVEYFG